MGRGRSSQYREVSSPGLQPDSRNMLVQARRRSGSSSARWLRDAERGWRKCRDARSVVATRPRRPSASRDGRRRRRSSWGLRRSCSIRRRWMRSMTGAGSHRAVRTRPTSEAAIGTGSHPRGQTVDGRVPCHPRKPRAAVRTWANADRRDTWGCRCRERRRTRWECCSRSGTRCREGAVHPDWPVAGCSRSRWPEAAVGVDLRPAG